MFIIPLYQHFQPTQLQRPSTSISEVTS